MGAFLLLLGDLPGISRSAGTTPVLPSLHFSRFPRHSICLSPSNELPGEPRSRFSTQEQTDSAADARVLLPF